jgi:hypothetical protein
MTPRIRVPMVALALLLAACTGVEGGPSAAAPSGSGGACATTPEPDQEVVTEWAGSQAPSVFPQIINPSGTLACGPNRFLFSFLDDANTPVASPDRTVEVALYDLGADSGAPGVTAPGTFIWAIEPEVGLYVATVDLPTAGLWGAEFRTSVDGGATETIRVPFDVRTEASVVSVGDPAPASDTPTLADVDGDVALLSTDEEPVEAFYKTSVADALEAGEPFLLVFATPKFCATAQCGPTLDRVKAVAAAHPELTVINVEPYQLEAVDGQLQPVLTEGQLTPAPATDEWRLPAEPWVFLVDGDGIVRGSYMLVFDESEVDAAIAALE